LPKKQKECATPPLFLLITIDVSYDNNIDNNIIGYWHEKIQLTKNNENILLKSNRWLNDQHLVAIMQILYVQKLQSSGYQQH
jgi:hypothetical protein